MIKRKRSFGKPIDTLPESVYLVLGDRGVTNGDVIFFTKTDIDREGRYRNSFLVLTCDALFVVSDNNENEEVHYYKGYAANEYKSSDNWSVNKIELKDIDKIYLEMGVACNVLVYADYTNKENIVSMCTNLHKSDVNSFIKLVKQVKKKEEYEIPVSKADYCPNCGRMYPDDIRKICPHCMDRKSIFIRCIGYFKPYKVRFIVLFIATLITAVLNLVWPYLNGTILYDSILAKNTEFFEKMGIHNVDFVVALLLLVLTMFVTKILLLLLQILQGILSSSMSIAVVKDMKQDVFKSMGRLSINFYKNRQTGGLMTRVMSDADRIIDFFIDGAPYILIHGFTMITSLVVMLMLNVPMSLVTIATFPVLIAIFIYFRPKMWIMYGKRHRAERSLNSGINDNLTGARVVKSFGQEEKEIGRFTKNNERLRQQDITIAYRDNYFRFIYTFAQSVATMGAWFIGVYLIFKGKNMSTGTILTFVGYVGQLQGPMMFFSRLQNWWADSMNSAQRMFEIIDAIPDVIETDKPVILGQMKGDIAIHNMTFGYDTNRPVLKNIELNMEAGKMYGIVGRSGAGKTTLVNLISRLYDVNEGEILIDGINVKDLSFEELRRNVAMVSQDTYIFAGTVTENIAYAKKDATKMEVIMAAKLAGAHEFIMRMPDGYDTLVGAGGRTLSGGEKQRISIARAILADPRILILDEATASVDTETERVIQKSLNYLVKGRTTLSIAHRLSTLRDADYLVVIDNGRITERGTHTELVELKGTYYKLLELQTKAGKEEDNE